MIELCNANLGRLPRAVEVPRYDRAALTPGVVHLGVGNFHRAHQAAHIEAALNRGETGWGIVGVSLRRPDMRDALAAQDGLYTLVERGATSRVQVTGALQTLLVAPEDPAAVVSAIADPRIRLVTLTITEKGYGLDAARSGPDFAQPDLAHDLDHPESPRSAAGLLLAALRLRCARGAPPVSLLSCDNLSGNGRALQALLRGLARAQGDRAGLGDRAGMGDRPGVGVSQLLDYLEAEVACPSSMVDRIVPHTTDGLRRELAEAFGLRDRWPVATEAFSQWVLEDRFAGQRPGFERSGVQLVRDVEPYEAMKLRMLNAAHSAIAYLGVAAGWPTVDAAVAQPVLRRFIERLWRDEVVPTLPAEVRAQAPQYAQSLMDRFANRALGHRCEQIAMDGSLKIPLRWLPTLRERQRVGAPSPALAMCLAAWMRHLGETDESGARHAVNDPQTARLVGLLRGLSSEDASRALLSQADLFGDLGQSPALVVAVSASLDALKACGTLAALDRLTGEGP